MPTFLPFNCGTKSAFENSFCHPPCLIERWALAIFLDSDNINPIAKSLTASAFLPITLKARIFLFVASSKLIFSFPARAKPTIFKLGIASINLDDTGTNNPANNSASFPSF